MPQQGPPEADEGAEAAITTDPGLHGVLPQAAGQVVAAGETGRPPAARRADWVPWLIALAVFGAYSIISISRYVRLDPGSWDLGIFTEDVKQFAHLRAPVADIKGAGVNLLGDHFQPIVALIAPFFRLAPSPVTLLLAQALLLALSVVPVSRAAAAKLGTAAGRMIGAAYGFSWGLQQMIDFDFHEIAFAVPLLACSLSALLRGRTRAAALWAMPLVFVKEDQGFTVAAIGILIMINARRSRIRAAADDSAPAPGACPADLQRRGSAPRRRPAALPSSPIAPLSAPPPPSRTAAWTPPASTKIHGTRPSTRDADTGLFLMFWGIAWSLAAIAVIIPHFNVAHQYPYWYDGGTISIGAGHHSMSGLLSQVTEAYRQKLDTTGLIFLPVAFLALRSPITLVAVPSLALRFISTNSSFWGTAWHYNATVMPIVFIAAIDVLARIGACRAAAGTARRILATAAVRLVPVAMLAIAVVLAFRFPLDGLWQPQTYTIDQHVRAENEAMVKVPAGVTAETTLTMLAPLAARADTFWIGTSPNPAPQYIVFDDSDSGWSPAPVNVLAFVESRHPGTRYRQIFLANDVYVFRRS